MTTSIETTLCLMQDGVLIFEADATVEVEIGIYDQVAISEFRFEKCNYTLDDDGKVISEITRVTTVTRDDAPALFGVLLAAVDFDSLREKLIEAGEIVPERDTMERDEAAAYRAGAL